MNNLYSPILVFDHFSNTSPQKMGSLFVDSLRGEESFSFEYDSSYLKNSVHIQLDPELDYFEGRQYASVKPNFGIFEDSAPDRWGRTLMDRREQIIAREEGRKPRKLLGSDYLLGVFDETRMGGLRFSLSDQGPFLANDSFLSVPPWISLRSLEERARQFEKEDYPHTLSWLDQLLRPGSSLGGARPKANIIDHDGHLWIAKFPSLHDRVDVGAWEMAAVMLAKLCGINVPEATIENFGSAYGSTFLTKRFDRAGTRRIHFASAMTMLEASDGSSRNYSYLDIADFLLSFGAKPKEDLEELWKRIVFSIAISNTDDHLRNHGFLLDSYGWRLSPAYDLNPEPMGQYLSLAISETDSSLNIELAISNAEFFGISSSRASAIAADICRIVDNNWEGLAKGYHVSRKSIEWMRPAFLASKWRP